MPCSTIEPLFKTTMESAFWIVLRRCAIMSTVRFFIKVVKASCTSSSDLLSKALVASSNISIFGFFNKARAIAIRCF